MNELPLGIYQHYKGPQYEVLGVVRHSETGEKLVLYKALYTIPELEAEYGPHPSFVRPYEQFVDTITHNGETKPRFQRIEN